MREFYPHLNTGMSLLRGVGYPKQQFANSFRLSRSANGWKPATNY